MIPESHATGFGCGQCGDRAFGNHPCFRFTDGRHNMECQPIGGGHITGHELDTGIHQVGNETYRSCESVEFGDDQGGLQLASQGQCFSESWPFGTPARFDLDELAWEVLVATLEEGFDGGLLTGNAQAIVIMSDCRNLW